jgi:hypothetical protein
MKKIFIFALAAAMLVLSACGSSLPETALVLNDKTVQVNTFDIDDYEIGEGKMYAPAGAYTMLEAWLSVDERNYKNSDAIAYGEVLSVENYDEESVGQTIYTFRVDKALKGELKPGDVITVMTKNGYCRLSTEIKNNGRKEFMKDWTDEYIEKTVIEYSDGSPQIKVGDVFLSYFIHDFEYEGSPRPKGLWLDMAFEGRFAKNSKGKFGRYIPEEDPNVYDKIELDPSTGGEKVIKEPKEYNFSALEAKLEKLKKTVKE